MEIEEAKWKIVKYLYKGWKKSSPSSFGSPIFIIKKKDGGLRFIVDYRILNKLTIKHRYPLPSTDDLFDQLADSCVSSSLDLSQGYHQIQISKEGVPKIPFRVPFGH